MSTLSQALDSDPERMTGRARAYMTICALRHILLGIVCVAAPSDSFGGLHFSAIQQTLAWTGDPMQTWGLLFILTGIVSAIAALTKHEPLARSALIASAVSTSFWATGFVIASAYGFPTAFAGAILLSALCAKDIVVSRQPLRSPFEAIFRTLPRARGGVLRRPGRERTTGRG